MLCRVYARSGKVICSARGWSTLYQEFTPARLRYVSYINEVATVPLPDSQATKNAYKLGVFKYVGKR